MGKYLWRTLYIIYRFEHASVVLGKVMMFILTARDLYVPTLYIMHYLSVYCLPSACECAQNAEADATGDSGADADGEGGSGTGTEGNLAAAHGGQQQQTEDERPTPHGVRAECAVCVCLTSAAATTDLLSPSAVPGTIYRPAATLGSHLACGRGGDYPILDRPHQEIPWPFGQSRCKAGVLGYDVVIIHATCSRRADGLRVGLGTLNWDKQNVIWQQSHLSCQRVAHYIADWYTS